MAPPPALGALGLTFTVLKAMQFCALVVIIGLSSAFVSDIVASDYAPPAALIGTLVVVSSQSTPHLQFVFIQSLTYLTTGLSCLIVHCHQLHSLLGLYAAPPHRHCSRFLVSDCRNRRRLRRR